MVIDKEAIRRLVPHSGRMCLIDAVIAWDDAGIDCVTESHRDPNHPLIRDGILAALHGLEYGAQAAAIHGGLVARRDGRAPRPAWLGALKDVRLTVDRLDRVATPLAVTAHLLLRTGGSAIYRCRVAAAGSTLAEGRITIVERGSDA